jgi:hypothetical protein
VIEQKGRLAEVEAARGTLRDLWTEHRRSRLVWHRASRLLRAREALGERMYVTERPPSFAISPAEEKLPPEVLRQRLSRSCETLRRAPPWLRVAPGQPRAQSRLPYRPCVRAALPRQSRTNTANSTSLAHSSLQI